MPLWRATCSKREHKCNYTLTEQSSTYFKFIPISVSVFKLPVFNILHFVLSLMGIHRYALYFILNHLLICAIYRVLYTLDMLSLPVLTGQTQLNVQFTTNILTSMHKSIQINLNHVLYCHKTLRDFENT